MSDDQLSIENYQLPEGYQQTEVGVIPENWIVASLGEIGQSLIGLTYRPEDTCDYGTLVLRSSNVQNDRLAYENNVYVDSALPLPSRVIVEEGDILICVRNGSKQLIGKCALIDAGAAGSAFGAFMSVFRTKLSNFVFYQFQSDVIQRQINEIMGATINQITNKDLVAFQIPIPPSRKEQCEIATALSDVDRLLAALEKAIAKKRAIKTATMQQLLTGKKRLPGFGEGKGYQQTEIGVIPEDWGVKTLGDIADVKTGPFGSTLHEKDYVEDGTPIITVEHLGELGVEHINLPMVSVKDRERLKSYSLQLGDIVFSRVGSIDRNALVKQTEAGWLFSGRLLRVRLNGSKNHPPYLSYHFHSEPFKRRIREVAVGQTMASLNTQILNNISIILPAGQEQRSIATVLSDMDTAIAALETRLAKTQSLKQGMMQQLLTGRVRLKIEP